MSGAGRNAGYRGDGTLSGVVARIRNRPKVAELEQQWRERQRQTRRTAALDRASDPAESLPRPEPRARLDTSEDESDNTRAAPARSAGANSEGTPRPDDVEDRARDPPADPDPGPGPRRGRSAEAVDVDQPPARRGVRAAADDDAAPSSARDTAAASTSHRIPRYDTFPHDDRRCGRDERDERDDRRLRRGGSPIRDADRDRGVASSRAGVSSRAATRSHSARRSGDAPAWVYARTRLIVSGYPPDVTPAAIWRLFERCKVPVSRVQLLVGRPDARGRLAAFAETRDEADAAALILAVKTGGGGGLPLAFEGDELAAALGLLDANLAREPRGTTRDPVFGVGELL